VVALEVLKVGIAIVLFISRSAGRGDMAAAHNGAGTTQAATIAIMIIVNFQGSTHVILGEVIVWMK
jgi:hypothetical protein